MAMAFWLLLEEIGYHDLTRKIHSFDNATIEAVFNETISCLECIQPDGNREVQPTEVTDSPVFVGLLDEPINRRFFRYNSEFMFRRFTHIMETVCDKIFGQNAAIEVDDQMNVRPAIKPFGEGSSRCSNLAGRTRAGHGRNWTVMTPSSVSFGATLNPNASEFVPRQMNADSRTMFLTFSKGYSLTRDEVFSFFTSNWGDVVEDVVVEQAAGGDPPLYGRVIFKEHSIINIILNGQSKAKFMVGRKHLWARIYVPRRG
ncbi:OLC1v1031737C1 [Oldenlandia corymbosa var. corymbosa]|uniref:OLC1v1031737C1 n=1 Tax=Oldenlandia corymbosa var. corymbosa TaxID=529605 RepID=A0AAV1CM45_OLDCO|nr:OLC1v1031737C1 [Oldenlandia corymbosa var. corymbosa]